MWFEALSGLRIDVEKSVIFPAGRVEDAEILAWSWFVRSECLPSYLRLPYYAHHKLVTM